MNSEVVKLCTHAEVDDCGAKTASHPLFAYAGVQAVNDECVNMEGGEIR